ncbi:MAG: hypothetical protein R2818_06925 [Flavobacteriales bacterium]
MGEIVIRTSIVPGGIVTQGFQQPNTVRVLVNVKAFLQGPYNPGSGAMNDGLRTNGLIPTTDRTPHSATPSSAVAAKAPRKPSGLPRQQRHHRLGAAGTARSNDNTNVLHSRSALLQADGDIVAMDGFSPVDFPLGADDYYLAVLHRNHLAVVSLSPIALSRTATTVDLSDGSTPTYGSNAQQVLAGTYLLWAGDVNADGTIKYTGSSNDRDPILSAIGGTVPTNTITGYRAEDVNMDGITKYSGAGNDRDIILQNIGGVVPTNTRVEQVP